MHPTFHLASSRLLYWHVPRRLVVAVTIAIAAVALSGCAIGPSTRVQVAPAPIAVRGDGPGPASARTMLDSIARSRATVPPVSGTASSVRRAAADTVRRATFDPNRDLSWLAVLRDTQLVALVREAVGNNLDLREAQQRVMEYRAQVGATRASLLPEVTATGATSTNRTALGPTVIGYDAVKVTGDVSWDLDFWGKARRNVEAARFDAGATEEQLRATTVSLVGDIATAYLQLREIDESLRISEQTLASRRQTLELSRRRFDQGVSSELDVWQFEADLADPAARVADFARQRTQRENQLSQLLGRAPGSIPRGRPLDEVVLAVSVPDSLSGTLVARRPDVRAAQSTLQAALARVGATYASRLPSITLSGQYGTQRPDFSRLFINQAEIYSVQLGVSVPLFTGGRLRNETRVAEARAAQAQSRFQQKVLTGLRESNDALSGVRLSNDQLSAQRTQVRALEHAFGLAEQRYRTGVTGYFEVLDAQRRLFTAQLSFVQTERQYLVATVDLYRALGGGWDGGVR